MGTQTLVCLNHLDRKSPESTFVKRFCEDHLKRPTYIFLNIFPSQKNKLLNLNKNVRIVQSTYLIRGVKNHIKPTFWLRYFLFLFTANSYLNGGCVK